MRNRYAIPLLAAALTFGAGACVDAELGGSLHGDDSPFASDVDADTGDTDGDLLHDGAATDAADVEKDVHPDVVCATDAECEAAAPACTAARCEGGSCRFEAVIGCCSKDGQCDDGDLCSADRCEDGACVSEWIGGEGCCAATPVLATGFSPAPPIDISSSAERVRWQVMDTDLTLGPPAALYMGDPEALGYGTPSGSGFVTEARFLLGPAVPGATVEVKARLLLDVRPGDATDKLVIVVDSSGGEQRLVHRKGDGPIGSWYGFKGEAKFNAPGELTLRLRFESGGGAPTGVGVLVDDLEVRSPCKVACTSNAECLSDDPCAVGSCINGQCSYEQAPACCRSAADCEVSEPCTDVACVDNACVTYDIVDCCQSAADCGPPPPCAVAQCVDQRCLTKPLPDCCTAAAECDDGDPCTKDFCEDGTCGHVEDPACCVGPDCCEPEPWGDRFDPGAPTGWSFENGSPEIGWQVASIGTFHSAPGVLYYGSPAAMSYDGGRTFGTATSPPIYLPSAASSTTLSFWLFMDVEETPDFDMLTVRALAQSEDGTTQEALVWQKGGGVVYGAWFQVTFDLTPMQGSSIRLAFEFDTVDDVMNEGMGVLVDDLRISAVCGAICVEDDDCLSGPPCTTSICQDGQCIYPPIPGCCQSAAQCDDGDPCTKDGCDATTGFCFYDEVPGCCQADFQCNDGDPCTFDFCDPDAGQCVNLPQPDCCQADFQCDDGDPCTDDLCDESVGQCYWIDRPDCCFDDADCADSTICTLDFCDEMSGTCLHQSLPGCCDADGDCFDGDKCTDDRCDVTTGLCEYEGLPECCNDASDCDDGNMCTLDSCVGGSCQHEYDINCCQDDSECDDGNPCTEDFCFTLAGFGVCQYAPTSGPSCCTTDAQCQGKPCSVGSCEGYQCEYQPIAGCCKSDLDCDDDNTCTFDFCDPVSGVCNNLPQADCCADLPPCNDGDPCTADACDPSTGECVFSPIAGCCVSTGDCDDGNPCTFDSCVGGSCQHQYDTECCQTDQDCNDGNACTTDRCYQVPDIGIPIGICQYAPASGPGCCVNPSDCVAIPCQTASCVDLQCVYQPNPDCCVGPDDCDDGDPCTNDFCSAAGDCIHEQNPDCCFFDDACDDGDPCTLDYCDPDTMTCAWMPLPGCCTSDAQCLDDDPCTINACDEATGQCVVTISPDCCTGNASCNDGDPCTFDVCDQSTGKCSHAANPDCCESAADCDDGDVCTNDICDAASGSCVNPVIPGCCAVDADCNDGSVCTFDDCFAGECIHTTLPSCCTGDAACNDGDPCTEDACSLATGKCSNAAIPACCYSAADCGDGDVCTADSCDFATHTCENTPIFACCTTQADCDDGDSCTADSCDLATGTCSHVRDESCCETDADCDDKNKCTKDACDGGSCSHQVDTNCCQTDAQCNDGNPCTADTCFSVAGYGVCQYQPVSGPGCCMSASNCSPGACEVAVCEDYQCSYVPKAGCCTGDDECDDGNPCTLDACEDGSCTTTPSPDCCTSSSQCSDDDPCTQNLCDLASGQCTFPKIAGCCAVHADCDDGNPCTQNTCNPNTKTCVTKLLDSCCQTAADCDDGDPCTVDVCDAVAGTCTSTLDPACCTSAADCDDGDPCTDDACDPTAHSCTHTSNGACCEDTDVVSNSFSQSTLTGWNIDPAQSPGEVTWWISQSRSVSAPSALYMGNPLSGDYDDGGTPVALARTPLIPLPDDPPYLFVSFQVWLDIEELPSYDVFEVRVRPAGSSISTTIWTKDSVPVAQYRSWAKAVANLAPWQGQSVRLEFYFDAIDPVANNTEGIYVDDLLIHGYCDDPGYCNTAGDCDDGDPCTVDLCSGGSCSHEPSTEPPCCEAQSWYQNAFDTDGGLAGFTVLDDNSGAAWQSSPARWTSAPFALYYGKLDTMNYDTGGQNQGTATSPPIDIPADAGTVRVSFRTWVDVEPVFFRDRFTVRVLIGDQSFNLWSKNQLDESQYASWQDIEIEVPAEAAGQTIRVQFAFDSTNGFANDGEGIYVDDFRVHNGCEL